MKGQVLLVYGARTCLGSLRTETPSGAARLLGYNTVAFSPPGVCAPGDPLDQIMTIDLKRPDEVLEAAAKLNAQKPLAAVIGCDDDSLVPSAMIAEKFGLPTNPVQAAFAAMDKPAMKDRFLAAGVPTAEFTLAADEADAVRWAARTGYPVVVKPSQGRASQGVIRADGESELREAYRRLRRIVRDNDLGHGGRARSMQLVERYVDGAEVSCELIIQDGKPEPFAIHEKPLPLTGPFFEETVYLTPPTLPAKTLRVIEQVSVAAARAIGLRSGPAHCELRLTDDGPYVVEIAGRALGNCCATAFRERLGQDIQPFFVRVALGQRVTMPKPLASAPVAGAMALPVPGEGRVVAVHGVQQALRLRGIRDVEIIACPGQVLVPFPEQSCYAVGFVTAVGPSHKAVIDSLSRAASTISVEVTPAGSDRWVRPVGVSDAAYRSPSGCTPLTLTDLPRHKAHAMAAEYLAGSAYDELPREEALRMSVQSIERGTASRGEPAWVFAEDKGISLGFVKGQEGYIERFAVLPEQGGSRIGEVILRLQIAEFARRGCTRAVCETDPRLRSAPALLRSLGFALQHDAATTHLPTKVLSCSLSAMERRRHHERERCQESSQQHNGSAG